jgi:hypothetical protein
VKKEGVGIGMETEERRGDKGSMSPSNMYLPLFDVVLLFGPTSETRTKSGRLF